MNTLPPFFPHRLAVLAALSLGAMGHVQAQSLSALYQAARGYDAAFQSAQSQQQATLAKAEQALAQLRPTVGLSASANQYQTDVTEPTGRNYSWSDQKVGISASHPLYRPANRVTAEQGQRQIALAQAQLEQAEQDLMVRVSQAYFDVLAASDTLTLVQKQKAAVSEQLAFAQRNFEVGTSTVTDSREAQAKYDLVLAQELAAENDLRVKRMALNQLVGTQDAQPAPVPGAVQLPDAPGPNADHWVQQAHQQHPALRQLKVALEVAELETAKAEAGNGPTLDLVGGYQISGTLGSLNSVGVASNSRSSTASVGLSFSLPLYTGGAVSNRIRETVALQAKAATDLEASQRTVAQGVRTAYFGLQSGLGQVKALQAAEISSQSALDANQLGYQVGVRINIDVLNAQTQLYDTKTKLAKARYDVLLGSLKLRQASGILMSGDLDSVSTRLAP